MKEDQEACFVCGRTPKGNSEYSTDYLMIVLEDGQEQYLGKRCRLQAEKCGALVVPEHSGEPWVIDWKAWALYLRKLQVDTANGVRGSRRRRRK